MTEPTDCFQQHRSLMFGIAYRMLGSVSDADDVLQDAWLRWHQAAHDNIASPAAFLTRIVTRLCIDQLRARKTRQQLYVGPWLPEPLPTAGLELENSNSASEPGPCHAIESLQNLSIAFLLLLEKLSPRERAVFILKQAFDFEHAEIAEMLEIQASGSRQLLSRAKRRMDSDSNKYEVDPDRHKSLMTDFMAAIWQGNTADIKKLLTDDAIALTDGGGIVTAARIPLQGPARIIQVFSHLAANADNNIQLKWLPLNGSWGLALHTQETVIATASIAVQGARIDRIYVSRNPNKLGHIAARLGLS